MSNLLPPLAPPQGVFGVEAEVTPLGGAPVTGTIIIVGPQTPDAIAQLGEGLLQGSTMRFWWSISVPKALTPELPAGSSVFADIDGGGSRIWRIDHVDTFIDEFRAYVT